MEPSNANESPRPVVHCRCPLCGGDNACTPAGTGRFDLPCWCTEVRFAPELLARVPPEEQGRSCICQRCAESV